MTKWWLATFLVGSLILGWNLPPSSNALRSPAQNAGWGEFGIGSAENGGISNSANPSVDPSLAIDAEGNPVVAWFEKVGSDWEIYLRQWNGKVWVELNGSASGNGISDDSGESESVVTAVASDGAIIVVWTNYIDDYNSSIFVRRWNGSYWSEMGMGSASGSGLSNTSSNASTWPSLIIDSEGLPIVAWSEYLNGSWEIYVRHWNGTIWTQMGNDSATGGGISRNVGYSTYPSLARSPDGTVLIAWNDNTSGNHEIYVRRWNGSEWVEWNVGSASGGGISKDITQSTNPSLAIAPNGNPMIAWHDFDYNEKWEIYARDWNGSAWVEMDGSATGGGISQNATTSVEPQLAISPDGTPVVAWMDFADSDYEVYLRRWNGSMWVEMDAGSATGGGVSDNFNSSYVPSLAINSDSRAFLTWDDLSYGNNDEIIVRTYERVPSLPPTEAFLPAILMPAKSNCFSGPYEWEPNNKPAEAVGPLCASGTFKGYPNDKIDYFTFDTIATGNISVTVNDHFGLGVQLHLYFQTVNSTPVALDLSEKDGLHIEHLDAQPGRYYILIYTETPKPTETREYKMLVSFP